MHPIELVLLVIWAGTLITGCVLYWEDCLYNHEMEEIMKDVVLYQGRFLAKNSEAYKLWESKKWKELDAHLAKVRAEAVKRGEFKE